MKFIAIIPARYSSVRFPGKPLAKIGSKPVIQHVWEKVKSCINDVYIATDDNRIKDVATGFGAKTIMTSSEHQTGTDRLAEAVSYINNIEKNDIVINVQGDEPFIKKEQIESLKNCFADNKTNIATLVKKIENESELFDINKPKIVFDKNFQALYFSRDTIPYLRGVAKSDWSKNHEFYKHIGIYAYRIQTLLEISKLAQGKLETAEKLEQLRWLENGYKIMIAVTNHESIGIDVPEDLIKAEEYYLSRK